MDHYVLSLSILPLLEMLLLLLLRRRLHLANGDGTHSESRVCVYLSSVFSQSERLACAHSSVTPLVGIRATTRDASLSLSLSSPSCTCTIA